MTSKKKFDCGFPTMKIDECGKIKNCCWKEVKGDPFCFYENGKMILKAIFILRDAVICHLIRYAD